jgi:hypothetical protein
METINAFSSNIYKFKIDPLTYDKQSILNNVVQNYQKSPMRNKWDSSSRLHHYYNDWDNSQFESLDFNNLCFEYDKIFKKFIDSLNVPNINYRFNIVNVTVGDGTSYMAEHDHYAKNNGWETVFSCTHYLSFKEGHTLTCFVNPNIFAHYHDNVKNMQSVLDMSDIKNSSYCRDWFVSAKEDDFIIFPSYLKHKVEESKTKIDGDLRVIVVTNLDFQLVC